MANGNGILDAFGNALQTVTKPFTLPFENAQAALDQRKQALQQEQIEDTRTRLDWVDQKARQYGDPGSGEYTQAFTTYGSTAGFTPQQTQGFLALKTSPDLQKLQQLAQQVKMAGELKATEYSHPISQTLLSQVENLGGTQAKTNPWGRNSAEHGTQCDDGVGWTTGSAEGRAAVSAGSQSSDQRGAGRRGCGA